MEEKLLEINGLRTYFFTKSGVAKAVDGVSFDMTQGETLGVVGESGCGKSVMSASIIRLLASKSGKIVDGTVTFNRTDVSKLSREELRKLRGSDVAMIFQDPMTTLDPVFKVSDQMIEMLQAHRNIDRKTAAKECIQALADVGIPDPHKRFDSYPFELSGGMCQRVAIAMAILARPKLIIADEPTTALDVTMQAQILKLLKELQEKYGTSILIITHNLGVVWQICDNVMVMYAGKVVEKANVRELYSNPKHPYTWGLMDSMPSLNDTPKEPLSTIDGIPPDLRLVGKGCNFRARCRYAKQCCEDTEPEMVEVSDGHFVACHFQSKTTNLVKGEENRNDG